MDDLLLFTPSKKSHIAKLEDLLKTLLKNGLMISPKKCQLFRKELQYTGNNPTFIKDRRVFIKPLIIEAYCYVKFFRYRYTSNLIVFHNWLKP